MGPDAGLTHHPRHQFETFRHRAFWPHSDQRARSVAMSPTTADDGRIIPSDDEVAALVFDQFPALAGREIGRRYAHADHLTVRIGDDYGALMPNIPGQDHLYARVAGLLEPLLPRWTFPYSAPIATGVPQGDFPVPLHLGEVDLGIHGRVRSAARRLRANARRSPCANCTTQRPRTRPPTRSPRVTLAAQEVEWRRLLSATVASGAPENRVLDAAEADDMWQRAAATDIDVRLGRTALLSRAQFSVTAGAFAGILIWHRFGAGDPAADLGYAANLVSLEQFDGLACYGLRRDCRMQRPRARWAGSCSARCGSSRRATRSS